MKTLQTLFKESRGKAVKIGQQLVVQGDRIPIVDCEVRITLLSPPDASQGISLKAKGGGIVLSDGSSAERLHIWHEPNLSHCVNYHVHCPNGELLVWNVYRIKHFSGEITEDCWTGDAGMVVKQESPTRRTYACNDWRSPFNASAIIFEIEWKI